MFDDDTFDKITADYDTDTRKLTVIEKDGKKECFSILTAVKTAYSPDDPSYSGYTQIYSDSGFVYLAKVNEEANIKFSANDLKNMIKPY